MARSPRPGAKKPELKEQVRKFRCTNCGACCHGNNKGVRRVNKDDNGVFYTLEEKARVLALWPWEAQRMRAQASDRGLRIDLRPLVYIVDKKEDRAVVLMWFPDHLDCIFLKDNRCSIWADRPFTCKAFPLYGHRTGIGISSVCPDTVRPPMVDDEEENGRAITEVYSDEVVYLFKDMAIFKMVFGFLKDLEDNDIIKWDKDASLEDATAKIDDKNTRMDLFELIVETGILGKSQLAEVVDKLESIDEVKGRVALRIKKDMMGI